MDRWKIVTDILVDHGVSAEIQEHFLPEELYEFAEEICDKEGLCLENLLTNKETPCLTV
ncbi:hypothetical protein VPHD148_0180 [Vibrio phage D148]